MINPEELGILKDAEMQRFFAERMGPPQDGDIYAIESLPGKWEIEIEGASHHSAEFRYFQGYNVIRLPLPIDPRNPERGLAGMIKEFDSLKHHRTFYEERTWSCNVLVFPNFAHYWGSTPTLALLKTLQAQIKEAKWTQERNSGMR